MDEKNKQKFGVRGEISMDKDAIVKINSEYHHIGGEDLVKNKDKVYIEYRKRWNDWPKTFHLGDFPLFIDIESTNSCNLMCPFCSRTAHPEKFKTSFISFDMVKKIIDEGRENNLYGVKFSITGEPMMHKEIHKFVKYAKDSGLADVYFNTNATLLTRDKAKKLIEAKLDRLSISFEGYTKEVYESYRVGSRFETVIENIKNLQSLKQELGVVHPKIRVQTVLLPELLPDLKKYKTFWKGVVDEIGFLDYQPRVEEKDKILVGDWACPQLWQRLGILANGTIIPCNHDEDAICSLGNIKNTTIKEVWNSTKLNSMRKKHQHGNAHEIGSCKYCYLRASEINKLKEENK